MPDAPAAFAAPVPYRLDFEQPAPDEAETTEALIEAMTSIQRKTLEDGGSALRGVHAKGHGLLIGELRVHADLPPELAQGLFARPAVYPAVLRLSTTPGDLLDDAISTPRGLAVKVVGVHGEPVLGSEGSATQDFVLVNGPAFAKPDPKSFLSGVKLLAATTDRAPRSKKVLSAVLRGTEKLLEAAGSSSDTLKSLGGHPATHILGETFYSQVPLLYGDYMAKVSVVPVSPDLTALIGAPLDLDGHPNALREAVVAYFAEHDATWELRVQLCTDLDSMPIEDASVIWPESISPYRTVATLSAAVQPAWNEARERTIDGVMSFSPWNALAVHRPLGGVMRVRKAVYAAASGFRQRQRGEPLDQSDLLRQLSARSAHRT